MIYPKDTVAAMIGMRHVKLAGAALVLMPVMAFAENETRHRFTIGDKAFAVPVPQGYCLPNDSTAPLAEMVASLDTMNFTHADFQRCGSYGENYAVIKSPRASGSVPMPRAEFISQLARELQSAIGQQLFDEGREAGARDVARATGNEIQIDSGAQRFAGQDDMCAYSAMSMNVVTAQGSIAVRCVICMTVVGGEFMSVNAYAIESTGITEAELKTRARTIAANIAAEA
jgi:hypothetical protein